MRDYLWCSSKLEWLKIWFKNPSLLYSGIWSPVYPQPTRNENVARTWHFEFWLPQNYPWKFKFRQILALRGFDFWLPQNTPTTTPTPENSNLGKSWYLEIFDFWLPQNPPPLQVFWLLTSPEYPPPHSNLWNSQHLEVFNFWLPQNTVTPPPKISNLGRSWHLEVFDFWLPQNTPPPKSDLILAQDVCGD